MPDPLKDETFPYVALLTIGERAEVQLAVLEIDLAQRGFTPTDICR